MGSAIFALRSHRLSVAVGLACRAGFIYVDLSYRVAGLKRRAFESEHLYVKYFELFAEPDCRECKTNYLLNHKKLTILFSHNLAYTQVCTPFVI